MKSARTASFVAITLDEPPPAILADQLEDTGELDAYPVRAAAILDANPCDWGVRAVLAEVLGRLGVELEAKGQAWLVREGKAPDRAAFHSETLPWDWFPAEVSPAWNNRSGHSLLCDKMYDLLNITSYATRHNAELDLFRVLRELREI